MASEQKMTAADLIRRRPEVPEPCEGYAIVRVQKLDTERKTEGGVVIPDFTPAGLGEVDNRPSYYERYTLVSTSGCWYAGSTRVEHKAKPGDVVLMGPGSGYLEFDKDPRWPIGHRLIALQDVRMYYPCKTAEPMSKGGA